MSIIGQNPERDKWAKRIIYGGGTGYFALLGVLASLAGNSMGVNPGVIMKAKHSTLSKKNLIKIEHGIYTVTQEI